MSALFLLALFAIVYAVAFREGRKWERFDRNMKQLFEEHQ